MFGQDIPSSLKSAKLFCLFIMSDENSLSQKAATLTTVPLALHQILTGRRRVHCDAGRGELWSSSSALQKVGRYNECDTLTGHLTV